LCKKLFTLFSVFVELLESLKLVVWLRASTEEVFDMAVRPVFYDGIALFS
jgi:hypothetical protein